MIAKLWALAIEEGKKQYIKVPSKLKESVKRILLNDGYSELVENKTDGDDESNIKT